MVAEQSRTVAAQELKRISRSQRWPKVPIVSNRTLLSHRTPHQDGDRSARCRFDVLGHAHAPLPIAKQSARHLQRRVEGVRLLLPPVGHAGFEICRQGHRQGDGWRHDGAILGRPLHGDALRWERKQYRACCWHDCKRRLMAMCYSTVSDEVASWPKCPWPGRWRQWQCTSFRPPGPYVPPQRLAGSAPRQALPA